MTKKKPLGKALPAVSDSFQEPIPTLQESQELVAIWDEFAPRQYRGLLSAQSKSMLSQTGQSPKGRFVWDDVKKQYIEVATGRVLSRADLHLALSAFADAYGSR